MLVGCFSPCIGEIILEDYYDNPVHYECKRFQSPHWGDCSKGSCMLMCEITELIGFSPRNREIVLKFNGSKKCINTT